MEKGKSSQLEEQARGLVKEGKFQEAIALFQEACEIDSCNSHAWTNLGVVIYDSRGDPEKAIQALKKAVGLDPGNMLAWRGLGLVLQFMKKDHDGAVECYEKCLAIDPGNVEIRQLLKTARANAIVDLYHFLDLR